MYKLSLIFLVTILKREIANVMQLKKRFLNRPGVEQYKEWWDYLTFTLPALVRMYRIQSQSIVKKR